MLSGRFDRVRQAIHLNPYGTTERRSGSIAIADAAGGKARWSQSPRGQMRQLVPIGVAAPPGLRSSA